MNKVDVVSDDVPPPAPRKAVRAFAEQVLHAIKVKNWNITIAFCNDAFIRALNNRYRQKDEPTDVLSFTMDTPCTTGEPLTRDAPRTTGKTRRGIFYAGDIVISVETLEKNALYFSVDKQEELRRLIIHGILHLFGMDHQTNNHEREAMLVLQEKILKETTWT